MKVAVVGAGFSGLAVCWHLIQQHQVTLFDAKGIGGGASGIATGLLHPYPGEQGRRSELADEGIAATKELLAVAEKALGRPVADFSGIERLTPMVGAQDDVISLGEGRFLITSGITVFVSAYLEGLWRACVARGAEFVQQKITSLDSLAEFDRVILASGAGIRAFSEAAALNLSFTKGQVVVCEGEIPRSVISKGYLAKGEKPHTCVLGSTYEKEFASDAPDPVVAERELAPKWAQFSTAPFHPLEWRAAVRVSPKGHYFPLISQLTPKCWAITGMGSRGLLYHAYCAKGLHL